MYIFSINFLILCRAISTHLQTLGLKNYLVQNPKDLLIGFLNEVALPADRKISDLQYKPTNYLSVYSTQHLIARKESKNAFFDQYNAKRKTFGGGIGGTWLLQ